MRPDIHSYFLKIAEDVARRSTCLHRKVGAVLVRDGRILTTGYNGAPRGEPHCDVAGCTKPEHGKHMELCHAVHAEQNAIIQAAVHGVSIQGATLYCTHQPCVICARMLTNAGIVKTVFSQPYEAVE